jgi:hypothetical protein
MEPLEQSRGFFAYSKVTNLRFVSVNSLCRYVRTLRKRVRFTPDTPLIPRIYGPP